MIDWPDCRTEMELNHSTSEKLTTTSDEKVLHALVILFIIANLLLLRHTRCIAVVGGRGEWMMAFARSRWRRNALKPSPLKAARSTINLLEKLKASKAGDGQAGPSSEVKRILVDD